MIIDRFEVEVCPKIFAKCLTERIVVAVPSFSDRPEKRLYRLQRLLEFK